MKDKDLRNLNPHKPAIIAMCVYGSLYGAQCGGSMEFWDSLMDSQKQTSREILEKLKLAPEEVEP